MKAKALLTALLSVLLAGCILRGKPAKTVVTPAAPKPVAKAALEPPPAPLSIPQTNVELPKPQPVDPAALAVTESTIPEAPPVATAPARSRRAAQPPAPAAAHPPHPPPAATPEPTRETVQEIVPAAELKRLQDQAQARRREVNQILNQLGRRLASGPQRNVAATIRNFLALSEEAEKHNDLRQADALAERAQILAKELQSGK